jgi:hypothetical protein
LGIAAERVERAVVMSRFCLDTLDHVRAGGIFAGSVAPSLHRDC